MKIGYVRTSTTDQNTARQEVLMQELCVDQVFIDRVSGKNTDRPELKKMERTMPVIFAMIGTPLAHLPGCCPGRLGLSGQPGEVNHAEEQEGSKFLRERLVRSRKEGRFDLNFFRVTLFIIRNCYILFLNEKVVIRRIICYIVITARVLMQIIFNV